MSPSTAVQSPGEECTTNALGMEYGRIPDENITSNIDDGHNLARHGRQGHSSGWCAVTLPDQSVEGYLQITLSTIFFICAFTTQGHFNSSIGFVETYQLELSTSENEWDFYRNKDDAEVSNGRI